MTPELHCAAVDLWDEPRTTSSRSSNWKIKRYFNISVGRMGLSLFMASSHCHIRMPILIRSANQMATLYCADHFHTAWRPIQIPTLTNTGMTSESESGSVSANKPLRERWGVRCAGLGTTPIFYVHSVLKVCSHVTKFSPSPVFSPLLFSIVSMNNGLNNRKNGW